jgi:hypothetical protein
MPSGEGGCGSPTNVVRAIGEVCKRSVLGGRSWLMEFDGSNLCSEAFDAFITLAVECFRGGGRSW